MRAAIASLSGAAALALASGLALALVSVAPAASADTAADGGALLPVPACVAVSADARYVPWGYNHVVILRNGCSRDATCTVASDVSPQPQAVDVASGARVEVTTFMGSPAYQFVARVACRLH